MPAEMLTITRSTDGVPVTVPLQDAYRAVADALDAQDPVEFLAIVALLDGVLGDEPPEELLQTYTDEFGIERAGLREASR